MAVIPHDEPPRARSIWEYRVEQLEKQYEELADKLDRVNARLLGLALTIAASAIVFALTTLVGSH